MIKNIKQILDIATVQLKKCNLQTPQFDAEVLLAHTLKKSREFVLTHPEEKLTKLQIKNYKSKITRRSLDEPIAYIVGHKEFYGLDFIVNKHTLIPRPETELMVDEALAIINLKSILIDVGTGSGCIIVSIAKKLRAERDLRVSFIATDISKKALTIAKKNAKIHNVDEDITFLQGNLLDPIIKNYKLKIKNSSLLVIANLPYLSKSIYKASSPSVKKHEPKTALLAGKDGLALYRKLFKQLKTLSVSCCLPITVLCEISPEQKNIFEKEFKTVFPFSVITFLKDLSNKWRLAKCVL